MSKARYPRPTVPSAPLLDSVLAQPTAVTTLRRALATGRVHHAYLFDGPDGVGKELAAFGFAQALVCSERGPGVDHACAACNACRRALLRPGERRPVHPDVIVLERGLYEPAQIGRRTPENQDISVDQVRTLVLSRAAFPPHEGRAKVVIVRRAEEFSTSAANALLKTLEEPGQGTVFVLLSSQPDALLPTIRSRVLRVRFGPLADDIVARILSERGVAGAEGIASLCSGSVEAGLVLSDPEETASRKAFVDRALAAIEASSFGLSLELAEEAKKRPRAELPIVLGALAIALATEARDAALAPDAPLGRALAAAERHRLVLRALRQLEYNGAAQLVMETLLSGLRDVWVS